MISYPTYVGYKRLQRFVIYAISRMLMTEGIRGGQNCSIECYQHKCDFICIPDL